MKYNRNLWIIKYTIGLTTRSWKSITINPISHENCASLDLLAAIMNIANIDPEIIENVISEIKAVLTLLKREGPFLFLYKLL